MTPEALVTKDLQAAFSVLEQKGLGLAVRTPVLKGMLCDHTAHALGRKFYAAGKFQEACYYFIQARAVTAGREGYPDYTFLLKGGGVFLPEIKARGGSLEPSQVEMHEYLAHLGTPHGVTRSRSDFDAAVYPMLHLPVPKTVADLVREQDERWAQEPLPF